MGAKILGVITGLGVVMSILCFGWGEVFFTHTSPKAWMYTLWYATLMIGASAVCSLFVGWLFYIIDDYIWRGP